MEFIEYTIGELALDIKTGKTPPTSNPEYFDGDITWLGPSDLKGQKIVAKSERKVSEFALEQKKTFLYESGTVIISTIGDIGKTGIVKKPVASNQQLTGILVNEDIILPELFYYWIQLNKKVLENKANKAVISMLNNKLIRRVKVVFPKDIEDQYKIVGRLNRIQELIDKRVETIQLLDKYVRSIFLEMFGDPILDNRKFGKKPLSFFGDWKSGGTPSKDNPSFFQGNIPWYASGELNYMFLKSSKKNISNEAIQNSSAKHIEENSLLVGMVDTAALKLGITTTRSSCNQNVAFSKLNSDLCTTEFIYYSILLGKEYFLTKRIGARQKILSVSKIKNLEIPYPNVDLQKRFTTKSRSIEKMKVLLNQSLSSLKTLFQTTLQGAFSEENQIDEEEVFESLLQTFTKEDLKQGERLSHLLKWINCKEPRFSKFETYDLAWDKLRELLEDGSIEQTLVKDEIKLKVAK
jgi:type I restriction enzyme S subunit